MHVYFTCVASRSVAQANTCWLVTLVFHASGVFRISVRRGRSRGVGVWWRELGTSPEKPFVCPRNDKFGCIFPQFLTGRKHKPRVVDFTLQSWNYKAYNNSAKIIEKFTFRPGGGQSHYHLPSPEYATVSYPVAVSTEPQRCTTGSSHRYFCQLQPSVTKWGVNPFIATLKPQSNGPSCSNTVIGTLAVCGWAVTFGTSRRDWVGCSPSSPLLAVPMYQPTCQWPVYQLRIIRCNTIIAFQD